MKEKNLDMNILPIANINGREFLVDVKRREFRDFSDPANVIKMHSELGRQIIRDMQGTAWNSSGISTGINNSVEV